MFRQLSSNPITSIVNIRLSKTIAFFSCLGCAIQEFSINNETYEALNALPNANETEPSTVESTGFRFDTGFSVNAAACAALKGSVRPLWAGKSPHTFYVCVVPDALPPPTPIIVSRNDTGLIIGCAIGGVAIIAILLIAVLIRRKKTAAADLLAFQSEVTGGRLRRANGTGFQTLESSLELAENGLINIEELRMHKLDLADLKVTATKPLAAGAFGEVWLGHYGNDKVAIKRLKDTHVES
ncbi:hypothetical protein SPRG_09295 [Saprolegnia parasitica CBS 223.65]|uniref:Protein kinase domain-containing protein n=1 Tax=Saprolegnia parasitica (strain CBS 223.65) TaxID=695850 RepID=A0A067CEC2_SAPPC|nr:hypothetical protein SPRG_09295 [Saprolegnia parasitica CBS 223.65]KDO25147.1 hypothetical protein SPRG_09295 [Saprolegnia parasitica CBS 223.65]|eukprot:XP_012204215.1 hypothetical protein SPRG_09295 [Saprolegnia parasitica CBS 223.65]